MFLSLRYSSFGNTLRWELVWYRNQLFDLLYKSVGWFLYDALFYLFFDWEVFSEQIWYVGMFSEQNMVCNLGSLLFI